MCQDFYGQAVRTHPLLCPVGHLDFGHGRMRPGKRNTDPLEYK